MVDKMPKPLDITLHKEHHMLKNEAVRKNDTNFCHVRSVFTRNPPRVHTPINTGVAPSNTVAKHLEGPV